MKKFMVDNYDWTNFKEEYFTTAVKAATYIKKNDLKTFTIWIYQNGHYHIVMTKNHETIQIYSGHAIPKVLTDLVRWKGGEQNEQKER